jgi:hypothetical protein
MGEPQDGLERRTFIGVSKGSHGNPARFDEALESATEKVVRDGFVTAEKGPSWFEVTSIRVEIENQNVRTFSVGVSGPLV